MGHKELLALFAARWYDPLSAQYIADWLNKLHNTQPGEVNGWQVNAYADEFLGETTYKLGRIIAKG